MEQQVQCVYRLSERGEILYGTFNRLTGKIEQLPNALDLDITEWYGYREGNYKYYRPVSIINLVDVMCMFDNALAVIELDRIGAVIVTRAVHSMYLFSKGSLEKTYSFSKPQFDLQIKDIGIVKTKLLTMYRQQQVAHLLVDESNSTPMVHTSKGVFEIDFDYEEAEGCHSVSRYIEMANTPNAYASVMYKGNIEFVELKENKIKLIGG